MKNDSIEKSISTHYKTNKFRSVAAIVALAIISLNLSGCSMSETTKEAGKTAICAAGGSLIGQIRTGGAVSKFVAGVVADNSTGETKALAEKVANGQGGSDAVDDLANYVDELCN